MTELVTEGVWWLNGTRGGNVFLVDTGPQLVLIDTGFPGNEEAILKQVREIVPGRALDRILLTHAHRDHSGSARELRHATGARVVAGAGDTREARPGRWVLSERRGPHVRLTAAVRILARRPVGLHGTEVDERLEGEVAVAPGLTGIPTPGHTLGSYCYVLDRRGVAFVGDLVLSHDDGLRRPMALSNSDDHRYLESLAQFSERAPACGLPGHGDPVMGTFGAELEELSLLPRRHILSPRLLVDRIRRLLEFSRRVTERRRDRN